MRRALASVLAPTRLVAFVSDSISMSAVESDPRGKLRASMPARWSLLGRHCILPRTQSISDASRLVSSPKTVPPAANSLDCPAPELASAACSPRNADSCRSFWWRRPPAPASRRLLSDAGAACSHRTRDPVCGRGHTCSDERANHYAGSRGKQAVGEPGNEIRNALPALDRLARTPFPNPPYPGAPNEYARRLLAPANG